MRSVFSSFELFPFLNTVLLHARISWSIRLRWMAVVGFFIATLIARDFLDLVAPYEKIWYLLAALALINLFYYFLTVLLKEIGFYAELIILHLHIIIDLIFLTLIVHYAGGIENPVYLFYLFHVVISSIIFPGIIPLFFATFVVVLFAGLIYLEFSGIVNHYCIFNTGLHENITAIGVTLVVFTVTVYVSAYIGFTFMKVYRNIKRQIDVQNQKLMEVDKKKSEFFRFSSHELKSPIIAIKASIDGIVKSFATQMDEKALHLLRRSSWRAGQMLDIITDLLDLSHEREEADADNADLIDMNKVLEQVIRQDSVQAEEKNISVNADLMQGPVMVRAEINDLRKIFSNLMSNAVRYTEEGGKIFLISRKDGREILVSIRDTGIGISDQDLPRIFDEFYRSAGAKKVVVFGTGLGLSLVKKLVESYRGNIEVKSELGRGSEFIIRFPLEEGA